MHQRHNIRHNVHQGPMMRPPHIASQMNVGIAQHPQQVSMQQPPPQVQSQQTATQQNQQHANITMNTGPQMMSQYIPTGHQRGDPNRLGHHLPPSSQQQQPQQHQQQSQKPPPPPQVTLQQPQLTQGPQRISPQMHPPHYMKNRPPNINNNNHGGVNVNSLPQQHPQLQPPPPTSNISNQQIQHQAHQQQIPPLHQPQSQQQQVQVQQIPLQQQQQQNNVSNNSNNIYNQKPNHVNKIVNHQSHKFNTNPGVGYSKINQSKHPQQLLQSTSQSHHQQQIQLSNNSPQVASNLNQSQQSNQQSQIQSQSHQQNVKQQAINTCIPQTVNNSIQIQSTHQKVIQNPKLITSSSANNSISACTSVSVTNNNLSLTSLQNTQSNQLATPTNSSGKPKVNKNTLINATQSLEQQTSTQKMVKKQKSISATLESVSNIEHTEINALESISIESNIVPSTDNISSGKEKTPMCLVNELARYNQIQHQYRLIGEEGPAHSKRFTVILKLGDEEYTAEGLSIKKAQHTAAAEAITKTKYEHPPPKKIRHKNGSTRFGMGNITPTVELNALAMKLGERAVYVFDSAVTGQTPLTNISQVNEPLPAINQTNLSTTLSLNPNQQIISNGTHSLPPAVLSNGPPSIAHMPNYYCESNYQYGQFNSRNNLVNIYLNGNGMRFPNLSRRPYTRGGFMKYRNRMISPLNGIHPNFHRDTCKITLMVGKQKFTGIGPTVQAAKHDAASKALEVLKPIAETTESTEDLDTSTGDSESEIKSPISLVYEIGLKRNLLVTFEVKSEIGPPHLKNFITICKVGDITTEGEGNGKKISKKRAAKKMLEELKKLAPLSPEKPPANTYQNTNNNKTATKGNRGQKKNALNNTTQTAPQQVANKKRTKNVIKEKSEPENPDEMNPISRLIQIQQALKQREPVYTVVEEKGAPRRREFTIEVTTNGQSARGSGSTKKIAKKNAAKNLLIVLGYEPSSNNKENNLNIVNTAENDKNKANEKDLIQRTSNTTNAVKQNQQAQSGSSSRQIVPGLIHLPQNQNNESNNNTQSTIVNSHPQQILEEQQQSLPEETSTKKSDIEKPNIESSQRKSTDYGVRPKDQLLYLAQLLGFEANFTDYPKGNHGEYLTIVALFTDPPQLCHGAGENTDASQDNAALAALEMLSKLGLDNVKPKKTQSNDTNSNSDDNKSKAKSVDAEKK